MSRKDGLCKKFALEYDLFCNIWKGDICFFPENMIFFLQTKNERRWSLSKKYTEIWCYKRDVALLAKKQRHPCPEKIHLTVTFPVQLKKMIFIPEKTVFLLKYHVDWHPRKSSRSSHRRCSIRKGVLRNFAKFAGKDRRQSLFFNKDAGLRLKACNFIKNEALERVFSCEFSETSKKTFFTEHLWTTASGIPMILCPFMETFIDVLIYCFPVKKAGNLIYRTEICVLLQFMFGDILQWRIFNTLYHSALRICI